MLDEVVREEEEITVYRKAEHKTWMQDVFPISRIRQRAPAISCNVAPGSELLSICWVALVINEN